MKTKSVKHYFDTLPQRFQPKLAQGIKAVFQYVFSGTGSEIYHVKLNESKISIHKGKHDSPDVTLRVPQQDWVDIVNGNPKKPITQLQKRVKVTGNFQLAYKMHILFPNHKPIHSINENKTNEKIVFSGTYTICQNRLYLGVADDPPMIKISNSKCLFNFYKLGSQYIFQTQKNGYYIKTGWAYYSLINGMLLYADPNLNNSQKFCMLNNSSHVQFYITLKGKKLFIMILICDPPIVVIPCDKLYPAGGSIKFLLEGLSIEDIQKNKSTNGLNLCYADLRGFDLSYVDFSNSSLTHCNLCGSNLQNANLTNADLSYTYLDNADFTDAILAGTNFSNTDSTKAKFSKSPKFSTNPQKLTKFNNAKLNFTTIGINWSYLDLSGAEVIGLQENKNLAGLKAEYAVIVDFKLSECKLSQANFSNADLTHVEFSGSNMTGAQLRGAVLRKAVLIETNLESADFTGAELGGEEKSVAANLSYSYMANVKLDKANLYGVDCTFTTFYGSNASCTNTATMEQIDFSNAYMAGINLSQNILKGSKFSGACLVKVNFENSDLGPAQSGSIPSSLAGSCLQGADFSNSKLRNVDFSHAAVSFSGGEIPVNHYDSEGNIIPPPPEGLKSLPVRYIPTKGLDENTLTKNTICPNGKTYEQNLQDDIPLEEMLKSKKAPKKWCPVEAKRMQE